MEGWRQPGEQVHAPGRLLVRAQFKSGAAERQQGKAHAWPPERGKQVRVANKGQRAPSPGPARATEQDRGQCHREGTAVE